MGEHDCTRGVGEIRWIEVGNILDSDCIPCPECTSADYLGPSEAVRAAVRPWVWSWPSLVPMGDSNDTAPGLDAPDGYPAFAVAPHNGAWFGVRVEPACGAWLVCCGPLGSYGDAVAEVVSVWAVALDQDHDRPHPATTS